METFHCCVHYSFDLRYFLYITHYLHLNCVLWCLFNKGQYSLVIVIGNSNWILKLFAGIREFNFCGRLGWQTKALSIQHPEDSKTLSSYTSQPHLLVVLSVQMKKEMKAGAALGNWCTLLRDSIQLLMRETINIHFSSAPWSWALKPRPDCCPLYVA